MKRTLTDNLLGQLNKGFLAQCDELAEKVNQRTNRGLWDILEHSVQHKQLHQETIQVFVYEEALYRLLNGSLTLEEIPKKYKKAVLSHHR
jgi:hypothetical protein